MLQIAPKSGIVHLDSKDREASLTMDYENIKDSKLSNLEVRQWYTTHLARIPEQIDKTLPIEQQARQAFELRNQYKVQAREKMADVQKRADIEAKHPLPVFEERFHELTTVCGMTETEAYESIIESASRSNKIVNKIFGLE